MDKARWGLNKNELARASSASAAASVTSMTARPANTQICVFDYGDCELIFEVRGWPSKSPFPGKESQGQHQADQFCRQYLLRQRRHSWSAPATSRRSPIPRTARSSAASRRRPEDHFGNFVKAVRSRSEDLNADILEGHLSSACATWATSAIVSARSSRSAAERLRQGQGSHRTFERMEQHLKDNKISLDGHQMPRRPQADRRPGRTRCSSTTRKRTRMLTREYRKGFEVPAQGVRQRIRQKYTKTRKRDRNRR